MKKLLLGAVWLCIAPALLAQQHVNAWFRATLSIPVGPVLKVDTEFQHRRQNGFGNSDLLDKNLLFSFRSWVHFQYRKDLRLSVSPFAFFSNYRIIGKKSDETEPPGQEIRFSAAVEFRHKILLDRLRVVDRFAAEYRFWNEPRAELVRFRNRFGFTYDFTETWKVGVYDELLCNVSGGNQTHCFDHNRMSCMLEYKVAGGFRLEAGYIFITRFQAPNKRLTENNFFLNITYQLKT